MSVEVIRTVQNLPNDVIITEWQSLNMTRLQALWDDYASLVLGELLKRGLR